MVETSHKDIESSQLTN